MSRSWQGRVTGARLVGRVLDNWGHLPDSQFRALVRMALTALDDASERNPAATYFGGHERIGRTFRTWPDDDSPQSAEDRTRQRRNILREVRKAVKGLEEAGAIKVADSSRVTAPGISQSYLLTL